MKNERILVHYKTRLVESLIKMDIIETLSLDRTGSLVALLITVTEIVVSFFLVLCL